MKIITTEKLPIKSWCNEPEETCIAQAKNLANLPFAFKHIALMPDTHMGYGMPIGGVLATKEVIIPNAVGVDIGCGMIAMKTTLKAEELHREKLKAVMGVIRENVPLGHSRHTDRCNTSLMPEITSGCRIAEAEYESARRQMGTLGGGNHFIEIQKDTKDNIWIMIHSGSRNIGKRVADYYNDIAKKELAKMFSKVEAEWDLAFFREESSWAGYYMNEMRFCCQFAAKNREVMMDKITDCIGGTRIRKETISCIHNYAEKENHYGENVWVHRKGAILARKGIKGIIPGSQGTKSYIVEGLGEPLSFMSSSHGAGRAMGRKEAMRRLNVEKEIAMMDAQGIIHGIESVEEIDEAPSAYKNIDLVMEEQKDLTKIIETLTPMGVIKG